MQVLASMKGTISQDLGFLFKLKMIQSLKSKKISPEQLLV